MDETLANAGTRLGLAGLDWLVLGAYFALLIGTGIYFARRSPKDAREYFLAERSMPAWAVALSLVATMQSAATFIGVPEQSYLRNLTYLGASVAPMIAAVIAARVFLPRYYAANVASPYEFLESRFGPSARTATSWTYLLGRLLASGARTYIGALPLSLAIFGDASLPHVCVSIVAIMIVATLYTFVGGIRSVIWTDVLQVCVYMGAAIAAMIVLWQAIPASTSQIVGALRETDKLIVVDTSTSPLAGFSLWSVLSGLVLLNLAAVATDQDMVQRSLTCRDAKHAARGLIIAALVGVPVVLIFLVIGLLLHVHYQRPDLMGAAAVPAPLQSKDVFQTFILSEMPVGLRGLMIAGVLAVGPIGINATINSMASTLIADSYQRLVPARDPKRDLWASRIGVVGCGVALMLAAMGCAWWQKHSGQALIDFVLGVMSFAYAGLLGVFLCAVCTRRGSQASAICALLAGFGVVLWMQPALFAQTKDALASLTASWFGWASERSANPLTRPITFSYQLVIGTAIAFAVCCLGSRTRDSVARAGVSIARRGDER
jgi:SSS family transporter